MLNFGFNIVKLCYTALLIVFYSLFMSKVNDLPEKSLNKYITKL